jgi:hypothetical protein
MLSGMTRIDPDHWQLPKWHPDWDGDFTFAGLRTFAKTVHDSSDLDAKLAIIEDGYAHLDMFLGVMRIGLVYVNRGGDRAVPLFSVYAGEKDDELTTVDIASALRFLNERRTQFPEDAG